MFGGLFIVLTCFDFKVLSKYKNKTDNTTNSLVSHKPTTKTLLDLLLSMTDINKEQLKYVL